MKIAVIQGPNLNMLGIREQNIYGPMTLDQIHEQMKASASQGGIELEFFQSNLEGEIVDKIQECLGTVDGIIINPAAYTHTSIAITDALSAVNLPVVEVHISNIYKREEFRQKSLTAKASMGVITGFGPFGYHMALMALTQILAEVRAAKEARRKSTAGHTSRKLKMKNYILQNENSVYFECGYSCDNVLYLSLEGDNYFITDGRYQIEARHNAKGCEVIITQDLVKVARQILKKSKIKKIFFDPYDFSVGLFEKLFENLSIKTLPKPNFSKMKRTIKTDQEIEYLHQAMKLGRMAFDHLAQYIQNEGIGKSEKFLYFKAKEFLSFQGEYDLSFDPIVALNQNSAKPHALPTEDIVQSGDLLLVDAGLKYKRYCSDRTCTSFIDTSFHFSRDQQFSGKVQQKVYDTVRKAQEKAITKSKRVG